MADAIAKECPGLFEVEGKGRNKKASVKPAREHTRMLEKVLHHMLASCYIGTPVYMLLVVGFVLDSPLWVRCFFGSVCLHLGPIPLHL